MHSFTPQLHPKITLNLHLLTKRTLKVKETVKIIKKPIVCCTHKCTLIRRARISSTKKGTRRKNHKFANLCVVFLSVIDIEVSIYNKSELKMCPFRMHTFVCEKFYL